MIFLLALVPIITTTSASINLKQASSQDAISLRRTFTKGMSSEYKVAATVHNEARGRGLTTFMPSDDDINYTFYTKVLSVEAGNAVIKYSRPTISTLVDDGQSIDPQPHVDKLDQIEELTLSPINEVIDFKDISIKKKKPGQSNKYVSPSYKRQEVNAVVEFMAPFIQQVESLSVFIGQADSSVDFAPKFGLEPVKVGDTWKQTVGYEPQDLTNSDKKVKKVIQRLDLTYTYKGAQTWQGKSVLVVQADLSLDTDLAKYIEDTYNVTAEEIHLSKFPLNLTETMTYYLDPKTLQTLFGTVNSTGGFQLITTDYKDPVFEQKIKGYNEIRLTDSTIK